MSISVLFRVCYQTPLKNTVKGTKLDVFLVGAERAKLATRSTFYTLDQLRSTLWMTFFQGKCWFLDLDVPSGQTVTSWSSPVNTVGTYNQATTFSIKEKV
jgi:hypothetical protein